MHKHLNFICPTDNLETVIQQTFLQENYFYTSLGNSITLDSETTEQINAIIELNSITDITIFLSLDNQIIQSALHNRKLSKIKGMGSFYGTIDSQLRQLSFNQKINDIELHLITSYLNKKTNELYQHLIKEFGNKTTINALIYNRESKVFVEAESKLFQLERCSLN